MKTAKRIILTAIALVALSGWAFSASSPGSGTGGSTVTDSDRGGVNDSTPGTGSGAGGATDDTKVKGTGGSTEVPSGTGDSTDKDSGSIKKDETPGYGKDGSSGMDRGSGTGGSTTDTNDKRIEGNPPK